MFNDALDELFNHDLSYLLYDLWNLAYDNVLIWRLKTFQKGVTETTTFISIEWLTSFRIFFQFSKFSSREPFSHEVEISEHRWNLFGNIALDGAIYV